MFSLLVDEFGGAPNEFAMVRARRVAAGAAICDLASANVNDAGIFFPQDALHSALDKGLSAAKMYHPDSKGQLVAREAIASYYNDATSPENIIVTPGTSQSYFYLFKLLANAGDEILVPRPCYPLFNYIARLADVHLTYYDLRLDRGEWVVDLASLMAAITPKTRAITLISPHNPTGHILSRDESRTIADIATRHNLPLIIDEVFYDFSFSDEALPQRDAFLDCPLTFVLNGFSKMFSLPGAKIGWIQVQGKLNLVQTSIATLETIADTFLATNEAMQFAVPEIFEIGKTFLPQYQVSIRAKFEKAKKFYTHPPRGGFYGTKYIGQKDEHQYALQLLEQHGVLVHPGYFFDLPEGHIVFSFLQIDAMFDAYERL